MISGADLSFWWKGCFVQGIKQNFSELLILQKEMKSITNNKHK